MLEKRDIERQRKAHANRVRKRERNRMIEVCAGRTVYIVV